MTLRTILFGITGVLLLLVLGFSATNSYQAFEKSRAARTFLNTDRASELLLKAAGDLAIERGFSNGPLHSPDPLPAERRAAISEVVASIDRAIDEGIARLRGIAQMRDETAAMDRLEKTYRNYAEYRRTVADNLTKPLPGRRPEIVDGFAATITGVIDQVTDLRVTLETVVRAPSSDLAVTVQFRHIVAEMAEQAGRERAVFGGRISQRKPFTLDDIRILSEHRGHIDMAWNNVRSLLLRNDLKPELAAAIRTVDESYMKKLTEVRSAVLAAAATGEYPISGRDWVDTSGAAIATILKLAEEIGRTARNSTEALVDDSFRQTIIYVLLMFGGIVIAGFGFWVVGNRVINPIAAITSAMRRLADGDNAVEISGSGRSDEIGAMAAAVQVFKDNAIEMTRLQHDQQRLKDEAEIAKRQSINGLADSFEKGVRGIVDAVASAASEMQGAAQTVSATADQTSRRSLAVGATASQASTNVQAVAAASEELSLSISEISRQVAQSTKIAGGAADEMQHTDQKVQGLAAAAEKIGTVVALINDIAGQTNLLALNATIEAARAGEAGRGFAVVASEVKALASQTGKATEEIAGQIKAIQAETQQAVAAIRGIAGTITEINQIAAAIASAVEQQGAATQEIARNVQQVATGTNGVSQDIAAVTTSATESGAAATKVFGSAQELTKQAQILRREVDGFLQNVRAA